jgi:hypothetical protein
MRPVRIGQRSDVTAHRCQAVALVCAVGAAILFAGLWLHARASTREDTTTALIIDLGASKDADVNMPIFMHVYDRHGDLIGDVVHHGLPFAVRIAPDRYPVVVKVESYGCSARVIEGSSPLVDVTLVREAVPPARLNEGRRLGQCSGTTDDGGAVTAVKCPPSAGASVGRVSLGLSGIHSRRCAELATARRPEDGTASSDAR